MADDEHAQERADWKAKPGLGGSLYAPEAMDVIREADLAVSMMTIGRALGEAGFLPLSEKHGYRLWHLRIPLSEGREISMGIIDNRTDAERAA